MKITIIAGARPNFIKIAPIIKAIQKKQAEGATISFRLVHTGQHYDKNLSDTFFEELSIPHPDANLEVKSGSQAEQTAAIMIGYEKVIIEKKPDLCLVVGDVTSTMACAITAQKSNVKVAHVEAGIRSGDWTMPEEINRMVTDSISNYFFTTTQIANNNLKKNGVEDDRIFWVGNTMIDTLLKQRKNFIKPKIWDQVGLIDKNYIVMTLHRPANVDKDEELKNLIFEIAKNCNDLPIIFPVHPRTQKIIETIGIKHSNLHLIEPQGYLEFNYLVERAKAVITDSGGITEETTVLGVPCITLRNNTERPETVTIGTNELIGTDPKAIEPTLKKLFSGNWKSGSIPELWDGNTAHRLVQILIKIGKL
jgi:UDP-N-acetylglucosamine 2-epimerase (non-hydrolysing)